VLIAGVGMFGVFLFLTYYLQGTLGYSPVRNGLAFLPMVAMLMVLAQLATNVLVPRIGPKVVVPIGLLLAAGGMVWLTRLGLGSTFPKHVLPPLLVIGAGLGLAMPTAISRATLGVQMADQGVASATTNTTQQIGGSIGTALLNTLATSAAASYVSHHLTDPMVQAKATLHSYATAYWWSAGFFALGAVVTAMLFRPHAARAVTAQPLEARADPGSNGEATGAPRATAVTTHLTGAVPSGTGHRSGGDVHGHVTGFVDGVLHGTVAGQVHGQVDGSVQGFIDATIDGVLLGTVHGRVEAVLDASVDAAGPIDATTEIAAPSNGTGGGRSNGTGGGPGGSSPPVVNSPTR
jgi:hypothetical protein